MGELDNDVAVLKTQVSDLRSNVDDIGKKVECMASKSEVAELKEFFTSRDVQYTKNMWKVIFGLLILLAALVIAAFGLKEMPALFSWIGGSRIG